MKNRKKQLYEETLNKWLEDEKLKTILPELIWQSGPSDVAAKLLIKMLKEKKMNPTKVHLFTYGAWFSSLNIDTFTQFLEELYKGDNGKYASVAIGMIVYYVEKNQALLKMKDIVLKFLAATSFEDDMTAYFWEKLSRELMEQDSEIIPCILDMLLRVLSESERIFRFEQYLLSALQFALKQDSKTTWNKLKDKLIVGDLGSWRLTRIIRGEHALRGAKSLLPLIPEEELWKWIDENPTKAPYILAQMVPLHEAEPTFHPIARKLLRKFPKDTAVKQYLSGNWHEEMYMGKTSEHYQKKLNIAQEWVKDQEPTISEWAENEVLNLKKVIEEAKIREEESAY